MTTNNVMDLRLLAFCVVLLGATTANAERITAADLFNGELPASTISAFAEVTWHNQNIGTNSVIFNESDKNYGLFYI